MKKVGIVTMSGNYNYGNRLQNYALQEIIKKENFDVETIWNEDCRLFKIIKSKVIMFLNYILSYFNIRNRKKVILRYKKFKHFTDYNIKNSKYSMRIGKIPKKLNDYFDYFFVGSDQIWNYTLNELTEKNFLCFSSYDKNISYAPSIGVDRIDNEWTCFFEKNLKNIRCLSCREETGAKEIKRITKRDCPVVLDPTMLLDLTDWDKISKKPQNMMFKKYILNYFLGELSEKRMGEIKRIAKENNCKIINILDVNDPFYTCGPDEFLYLEKNAFLICTDSFHSSVFAFLYNKPFVVFDREQYGLEKMNSRLDTLLSKFELRNRKFDGKITEENLKHDYSRAYKILEKEKKKSCDFIRNALGYSEK